jgi:hypothetical protein
MNKKERKIALAKLTKQAALDKVAEDIVQDTNNIEDPQQFADHIFDELVKNLKIDGLDD